MHEIDTDIDFDKETSYRWENDKQRSWEQVEEDEHGRIKKESIEDTHRDRKRFKKSREDRVTESIRRGLIRYMVVALDCSSSATEKDFKPSRLQISKLGIIKFISDFYDQNPISQLSFAVTRDRVAEKISDLSGSKKSHLKPIQDITRCDGIASLQNTLKTALFILRFVPEYGQKELLIIYNSLSTCDPGDIFETIQESKEAKLRVSIVCLAAEVYICKKIAEETGGLYFVAIDASHLNNLLHKLTIPPPKLENQRGELLCDLIYMGFPSRVYETSVSYGFEGRGVKLSSTSYVCPRCTTRTTDIPAMCSVCGLQLNSSSHISRSYHHLFPVSNFIEDTDLSNQENILANCYGCKESFDLHSLRLKCPRCEFIYCIDCDIFIHDSLHNCPGCTRLTH